MNVVAQGSYPFQQSGAQPGAPGAAGGPAGGQQPGGPAGGAVGAPAVAGGGPAVQDYSQQWIEYYRSQGMHQEADKIEAQVKAAKVSVVCYQKFLFKSNAYYYYC